MSISVNLWSCCLIVGIIIIWIWELIQHLVSSFGNLLFGVISWTFDSLSCWGQNNLCTISLHCLYSLFCWILRHNKFNIQIKHCCDHCKCNSCISTCCFNKLHSWLNLSSIQSLLYHIVSWSILDTSSWILTLKFCKNSYIWASENVPYLNQRCISNHILNIVFDLRCNFVAYFNLWTMEDFCVRRNRLS